MTAGGSSPEELQAQVEEQREQLADTIDALSAKLDVKAQTQARVERAKRTVRDRTTTPGGSPRPEAVGAAVAAVLVLVAVVLVRRKRR